jgi:phosphoribosyl 1,2-cyclic phosphodiesterase
MIVTFWGVRGSLPTPGPATSGFGGNTACVAVQAERGSLVVLDAGTGICRLGNHLDDDVERIDILLTHLHMDHIIGLGFFAGLHRAGLDVHLWGPDSTIGRLRERLSRYMSPPLFPVRLRELPCRLSLHSVPLGTPFGLPGCDVTANLICHPGATVGYRLSNSRTLAYLPDHEPALGARRFPEQPRWTSGYDVAAGADVVIHDAQYTDEEYAARIGWGHSTIEHTVAFAELVEAGQLVPFHHDPSHDDSTLERLFAETHAPAGLTVTPAREGLVLSV